MQLSPGTVHRTEMGDYVVDRFLGKGKSGYSYLARRGDENFVL